MDQALRFAPQALCFQLVNHVKGAVRQPAHKPMHVVGPVREGIERVLDAHPLRDGVPKGHADFHARRPHFQQSVEQFVRHGQPAFGFRLVMTDAGRADLLQVGFGLELVLVLVAHHGVGGIADRPFLADLNAETGVADGLVHADERIHHHVHREMPPPVKRAAEPFLVGAALLVRTLQGQRPVVVHFVPAHLVDQDHGPRRLARVELSPQRAPLLLHRQRGDFGNLCSEAANNCNILSVQQ